jgi:hypothetical protein
MANFTVNQKRDKLIFASQNASLSSQYKMNTYLSNIFKIIDKLSIVYSGIP